MIKKPNKKLYFFFQCPHCRLWSYSSRRIKKRKCVKCNKTFGFNEVKKEKYHCTMKDAIRYIKHKKEPELRELIHFINLEEIIKK